MLIMHPSWFVTFKPCKEIPEVTLRVSEPDIEAVLRTLRASQADKILFEREERITIPDAEFIGGGTVGP